MRRALFVIFTCALTTVLLLAVHPLNHALGHVFHGDVHALREQLRDLGLAGVAVLVALILVHAVLLFPSEILNATAGLVYGFGLALPLVMVSWLVSGLVAYWLGASAARPLILRLAGPQRFARIEDFVARAGIPALLAARLIPVMPYSFVGYAAGAARVPLWRFSWTTFVGILPITAAVTYLGHSLDNFSISDPLLWVAVAVLSGLAAGSVVGARRYRAARTSAAERSPDRTAPSM